MDIVHLIQSAVAPVFLLSGVGVTLGVLTGRLARIIDRARYLEQHTGPTGLHTEDMQASLRMLARRAKYTNAAIALCAASALFVSLVVMALFASAFLDTDLSMAIAILFVAAMICLTGAFGSFLVECRLATQILRFGTGKSRSLEARALRREHS
ncbi:MAG: DUF2721 domain-containing protein [Gammaproteobacteria bacterium]